MVPKPAHLGPAYATQFQDRSVVAAYEHRPPYPAEVFTLFAELIAGAPRTVLDAGCGRGDLARGLAPLVDGVEAVDASAATLAVGCTLPGGDAPKLGWIHAPAESAPLAPPYALITAGNSLHWMAWDVVLPRFGAALAPDGWLAIVEETQLLHPWDAPLQELINRYSTNHDSQPYDLVAEREARALFATHGRHSTAPMPWRQPVAGYIESFHARNGFSRERMRPTDAAAFDAGVRALVSPYAEDGLLTEQVIGRVVWGRPTGHELGS
jgi:SAM-dependent methyltransferase